MTASEQATARFHVAQSNFKLAAEALRIATDEAIAGAAPNMPTDLFQSIRLIQRTVAEKFGVGLADMLSTKRTTTLVVPRHQAIAICRILLDVSMEMLANAFGRSDHGSIVHAVKSVNSRRATEHRYEVEFKTMLEQCRALIPSAV